MEEVILPHYVIEAIEEVRKAGMTDFYIVGEAYRGTSAQPHMKIIIEYIRNNVGEWDNEIEKGYTHVMKYLVNTQTD